MYVCEVFLLRYFNSSMINCFSQIDMKKNLYFFNVTALK